MSKQKVYSVVGLVFFFAAIAVSVTLLSNVNAIEPTGGTVSEINNERAPNDTAESEQAYAGNVTEITLQAFSTTQSWQGYYGNITGTIQLADADDNVFYNWTLLNPEGEVYASTNQSITWASIQCFNFTADGTEPGAGGETAGAVNQQGLNLTQIEERFNINASDVDGVNETFIYDHGSGEHDLFYTASLEFVAGECLSTRVFSSTGTGVANQFEEVLMYEPATGSVVFTSLIEAGTELGFDGSDTDFEMLVLEDGHGTDTTATTYYFFVELE